MAAVTSRYKKWFQFSALLGDVLLLNASFFLAVALRFDEMRLQETDFYDYYVQLFVFINLLWMLLSVLQKSFDPAFTLVAKKSTRKIISVFSLHLFILLLLLVSLKRDEYSRLFLVYFYSFSFVLLLIWRLTYRSILGKWQSRIMGSVRSVVIGEKQRFAQLQKLAIQHPEFGLEVKHNINNDFENELSHLLEKGQVDEVLCTIAPNDPLTSKLFRLSEKYGIRFRFIPNWELTATP